MRQYPQPLLFICAIAGILFSYTTICASADTYKTVPDIPTITTHVLTEDVSDGYVFVTPGTPINESLLILDNAGEPVYYQAAPQGYRYYDFKLQPNGTITYMTFQLIQGAPVVAYQMDSTYSVINSFVPVGYESAGMDEHDILLLPNGNRMYIIRDARPLSTDEINTLPNPVSSPIIVAVDNLIQEVDADNNLIFEWDSRDYYNITDTLDVDELIEDHIDYSHGNSIEIDYDGNILFSARNMNEVTKIDRNTGDILWRMGGKNNEFTLIGDDAFFSFQHDARRVSADTITVFDNIWNFDDMFSSNSRVLEYRVDEVNKTAELIWEYEHPGGVWAQGMANAQRLPNGNTMIGWGTGGYQGLRERRLFSEVSADGELVYDVEIAGQGSYRAFRFDWEGLPTYPPTLIAERNSEGVIDLYYSWNGATNVATYELYGGLSPDALNLLTTQQKDGFENSYQHIVVEDITFYYQLFPYDAEGNLLTQSETIKVIPLIPTAITLTASTSTAPSLSLLAILLFFLYGGIVTQKIGRKR